MLGKLTVNKLSVSQLAPGAQQVVECMGKACWANSRSLGFILEATKGTEGFSVKKHCDILGEFI